MLLLVYTYPDGPRWIQNSSALPKLSMRIFTWYVEQLPPRCCDAASVIRYVNDILVCVYGS